MTEAAMADLTHHEAQALTERIRNLLEAAYPLTVEAYQRRAWVALGYDSWEAYCQQEFTGQRMIRLERDQRVQIAAGMRAAGMPDKAVAAAMGLGVSTLQRDRAKGQSGDRPSDPEPVVVTRANGRPQTVAPRPEREPEPEPTEVQMAFRWLGQLDRFLAAEAPKSLPKRQIRPVDPQARERALGAIDRAISRLETWRDQLRQETSI